jgi:hypothetical protein
VAVFFVFILPVMTKVLFIIYAEPAPFLEPELANAWAERGEHWLSESQKLSRRRAIREPSKQPLVLCGHGVLLCVEGGALTIRNGFTHCLQKRETYHFFKGELTIPPRIIMLDGNGSISFDVLALSEQNVPLIRIDWQGNVQCVLANNSYAANPYRVEWQRETRADSNRRMAFCIDLIARKIDGCIKTLEKNIPQSRLAELRKMLCSIGRSYNVSAAPATHAVLQQGAAHREPDQRARRVAQAAAVVEPDDIRDDIAADSPFRDELFRHARKQLFEPLAPPGEQRMDVPPLWDALARLECFGQLVALDDGDPVVMLSHGARRQEAAHACTDHDSVPPTMGHGAKPP